MTARQLNKKFIPNKPLTRKLAGISKAMTSKFSINCPAQLNQETVTTGRGAVLPWPVVIDCLRIGLLRL